MDRRAGGSDQARLAARAASAPAGADGFIGNAGVTLAGAAAGALLSMANEVMAARFLGVAGYGLYALAVMVARIGETMAVFGVPLAVNHFLPVHLVRGERARALGTVIGCIPLPLSLAAGFALALWFGGDWVAAHILGQPEAGRFLAVLGLVIPLMALADLLGNVARGFGWALPYVVIHNLTPHLCMLAVMVTLLVSHGPQIGVAYGQLLGFSAGALVGILFVVQLVRSRIGAVRPVLQPGRLYTYAMPVVLNVVMSLAIVWTDLFMLGVFTDATTVGIYRGCLQVVLVFELIWNAFSAATAPLYTVLIADGRRAELQDTVDNADRLATLLALPLLLVIVVNGADILGLLGPGFTAGAAALLILACGHLVRVAFGAASVVLNIGGRQLLEAGNVALAAVVNLLLNLLLIQVLGLVGAALSTALSLVALSVLRRVQLRRALGLRTSGATLWRAVLAMGPVSLAVWAASLALGLGPGAGLGAFALRLVAMGVLIGGSVWLFCLRPAERAALLGIVARRAPARPVPPPVSPPGAMPPP